MKFRHGNAIVQNHLSQNYSVMSESSPSRMRHPGALRWSCVLLFWTLWWAVGGALAAAAPQLHTNSDQPNAGYFRLTWDGGGEGELQFQLQEARSADFAQAETLYEGPDRASLLSGRPDGEYYYRVRAVADHQPGPWSEAVQVDVEHHSLGRAFLFFSIGAVVFLATLGLIVGGNLKSRKQENAWAKDS